MPPAPSGQTISIQDAAREIERLPRTPTYSVQLRPESLALVRRRCAASQPFDEARAASSPELTRAIGDGWRARAAGIPPSDAVASWSAGLPEAFRFDDYDNIHLYATSDPVGDQNAAVNARQTEHGTGTPGPILHISVYSRRHFTLTRHAADAQEQPIDGDFVLTQRIEAAATNTLGEFVSEISCRNSEIPAQCTDRDTEVQSLWTSAEESSSLVDPTFPAFSGAALETDTCVLVERTLYGRLPYDDPGSYVRALIDHGQMAGLPAFCDTVEGPALDRVTLGELAAASFGEKYWLLHVGDCEHWWTIDWARSTRANGEHTTFPRTLYLARWMQTTLARQYLAPKKLVVRDTTHLPCDICAGACHAVVAVVGGDQVRTPRLSGLPQMITPMCALCFRAAAGVDVKDALGKPHVSWGIVPLVPIDN